MTAPPPIDDEFLSAHLDGATTTDEAARIESDPDALARLAELRAARNLAGTPVVPLADADVDRLLAAASEASPTAPEVTDLAAARSRRGNRWGAVAAAAAAVVVLVVAVPVLGNLGSDDSTDDTASVSLDSAESDGGDDSGTDTAASDGGGGDDSTDEGGDAEAFSAAPAEDADEAEEELAADGTVDAGDLEGEGEAAIGGPLLLADLAVLLAPIEPVESLEALTTTLQSRLAEAELDTPSSDLGTGRSAVREAVASLGLALDTCADLYADDTALTLDDPDGPADEIDLDLLEPVAVGLVIVDGDDWVVVLLDDAASGEIVALAAPADTCRPVSILPVAD